MAVLCPFTPKSVAFKVFRPDLHKKILENFLRLSQDCSKSVYESDLTILSVSPKVTAIRRSCANLKINPEESH